MGGEKRYRFLAELSLVLPGFDKLSGSQGMDPGLGDLVESNGISPFELDFKEAYLDLSDIFDFGEKIGVASLQSDLYLGPVTFTAICVPLFTPSLLQANFVKIAGMEGILTIVETPGKTIGESSQLGLKAAANVLGWDLSLSCYYGRHTVPCVVDIDIDPSSPSSSFRFPRLHVLGADASGDLCGVGVDYTFGIGPLLQLPARPRLRPRDRKGSVERLPRR